MPTSARGQGRSSLPSGVMWYWRTHSPLWALLSCQSGDTESPFQGYCEHQLCSVLRGCCADGDAGQLYPFFLGELVKEISRISTTQHVTLNWGSQILQFDYLGITLNPLTWSKHVKITLKYIAHQIKDRNSLCKNNIACILTVILWLVTSIKIISDGAMPFKLGWGRRKSL